MSESLPSGWRECAIGDVCHTQTGNTPSKKDPANFGEHVPFVKPPQLVGGIVNEATEGLSEQGAVSARVAPAGSVLVSCIGILGKTALCARPVAFNQQINAIYPNLEKAFPRFLLYQAQSNRFRQQLEELSSATTVAIINKSKFNSVRIRIAPIEQQRRIADKIDELFSRIDEGERALKTVESLVERYRQSVLKAAVTGELTRDWREAHQHEFGKTIETGEQLLARILKARREAWEKAELEKMIAKGKPPKNDAWKKKYKEPTAADTEMLPMLPEGWVWATTSQICESVRDGTHDTPKYVESGVPLITSKNLVAGGLDFENVKLISRDDHKEISRRSGVEVGDILFAMIGTIGNPVVISTDAEFSIKNVGLFKAQPSCYLPQYLATWLDSPAFLAWLEPRKKGTSQKFAPLGLLREIPVPLPSLDEQCRIVALANEHSAKIRRVAGEIGGVGRMSISFRQSVLSAAFSGQLLGLSAT